MLGSIRRRAAQSVLATLAACCIPLAAQAATINIFLTDMDVAYSGTMSGGILFDFMGGPTGGSFVEATADDITSADFEVDSTNVGSLSNTAADGDDLHVDLRITNIGATIPKNVFLPTVGNNGFTFGLDFFTDTGSFLSLDTDEVSVFISNNTFFITGEVQLDQQNLPFGLAFDPTQPIQFSFSANFPSVPAGPTGTLMTSAVGSGVLTISGTAIPEPSTYVMLISGLVVIGLALVHNKRRTVWNFAPVRPGN
jgi:hypothetical protein